MADGFCTGWDIKHIVRICGRKGLFKWWRCCLVDYGYDYGYDGCLI